MAASRLPEIVSGLDLDADVHTFEDLLENEDWWAPYRTEFALSGRGDGDRGARDDRIRRRRSRRRVGRAPGARSRRRVRSRRGAGARVHGRGGARAARQAPASGAVVILGAPLERAGAAGGGRRRRNRRRAVGRQAAARVRRSRRRADHAGGAGRPRGPRRRGGHRHAGRRHAPAWPSRSIAGCGWTWCCRVRRRRRARTWDC